MRVRGRGGVLLAWGRGRRRDASPALCSKGLWAGIVVAWSFGGRWWGFWCSCVEDVRPRRLAKGAVVGGGIYGVCGVGSGEMGTLIARELSDSDVLIHSLTVGIGCLKPISSHHWDTLPVSYTKMELLALVLLLCGTSHAAFVDPAHARNITIYHVNEKNYSAAPVNMNTVRMTTYPPPSLGLANAHASATVSPKSRSLTRAPPNPNTQQPSLKTTGGRQRGSVLRSAEPWPPPRVRAIGEHILLVEAGLRQPRGRRPVSPRHNEAGHGGGHALGRLRGLQHRHGYGRVRRDRGPPP